MCIKKWPASADSYPNIIDAVTTYQKITKGNARKRQLGYISRQLRKLELSDVRAVVQRFDSSSPLHQTLIAKLEHYRTRLIESDAEVVAEISHHFPDVDRQHLMLLVRKAQRELSMAQAESGSDEESNLPVPSQRPVSPSAASKAVFSYLKSLPINTSLQTPSRNLTPNRLSSVKSSSRVKSPGSFPR